MTLAYPTSVYLRRNMVLMPSELSGSPDQAGSFLPSYAIILSPQSCGPSARLTITYTCMAAAAFQFRVRTC